MLRTLLADARRDDIPIEVILIDNGSRDGTLDVIQNFQNQNSEILFLPLGRNLGTTVTRNLGVRMAQADWILILDSDTELPPGTLKKLLDAADHIPDRDTIGIICPRLVYPGGDLQESARRFPTVWTKTLRLVHSERLRARDETIPAVRHGRMTPVDYAISAAWLVPRRTFNHAGYLDEKIFYAPEDVEFCARVWQQGLRVWYYPDATIIHNCQRITNKKPFTRMGLSHALGLARYWARYRSFFTRPSRSQQATRGHG